LPPIRLSLAPDTADVPAAKGAPNSNFRYGVRTSPVRLGSMLTSTGSRERAPSTRHPEERALGSVAVASLAPVLHLLISRDTLSACHPG
jgi:hypothetical protein